jgi:hypothetical protein
MEDKLVNAHHVHGFTQHARRQLSRRTSLSLFGAAALAPLARPMAMTARKNRSKNKNKALCTAQLADCNAQAAQCAAQVDQCTGYFTNTCPTTGDTTCQQESTCCSLLAACDANGFLLCIATASRSE